MDARRLAIEQYARVVIWALVIVGLAGCAVGPATEAPYVGVFTGEFVDGKPLYRFPSIEVVGSRRSVKDDSSEPDGS